MSLNIRKMAKSDVNALFALLSDPKVMKFIEKPYTLKQTESFLNNAGLINTPLVYAVEENEKFIGYVIYHEYDEKSMEIGWVLLPEYWGRGYALKLTDKLIRKAKQDSKGLVIECVSEQKATKHIALKKGFTYVGKCNGLDVYRLDF